jgi:hypothetical protein
MFFLGLFRRLCFAQLRLCKTHFLFVKVKNGEDEPISTGRIENPLTQPPPPPSQARHLVHMQMETHCCALPRKIVWLSWYGMAWGPHHSYGFPTWGNIYTWEVGKWGEGVGSTERKGYQNSVVYTSLHFNLYFLKIVFCTFSPNFSSWYSSSSLFLKVCY